MRIHKAKMNIEIKKVAAKESSFECSSREKNFETKIQIQAHVKRVHMPTPCPISGKIV